MATAQDLAPEDVTDEDDSVDWTDPSTYADAGASWGGALVSLNSSVGSTFAAFSQGKPAANVNVDSSKILRDSPPPSPIKAPSVFDGWAKKLGLPIWALISGVAVASLVAVIFVWHVAKRLL